MQDVRLLILHTNYIEIATTHVAAEAWVATVSSEKQITQHLTTLRNDLIVLSFFDPVTEQKLLSITSYYRGD